ncbi:MAG: hypothetical protein ACI4B6_06380 [Atopobiaceae bacterium]
MQSSRGSYRVRREHHVVRWIFLTLLALVVAYGVCLGVSAYGMYSTANDAKNQYSELSSQMSTHDFDAAAKTALKLNDTVSKLKQESNGWQWDLALQIPYVQDDVQVMQGLVDGLQQASKGALVPVAQAYQKLSSDGVVVSGSVSLQTALQNPNDVTAFVQSLSDAQQALQTSKASVDALGSAHLDVLNQLKDSMSSSLDSAASGLSGAGRLLEGLDKLKALVASL